METTREPEPPTDLYDQDLLPVRGNPRRLIACGIAATLAILAVFLVARNGGDDKRPREVHIDAVSPTSTPEPPATVPDRDAGRDSFFDRLFGDRLDGIHEGSPTQGEGTSERPQAAYSAGRCDFDMALPDGWKVTDQGAKFFASAPDGSAAVGLSCARYDGRPLEEAARDFPDAVRSEVGDLSVIDSGPVEHGAGYRLILGDDGDKRLEVTWLVQGQDVWILTAVYHDGDEEAVKLVHRTLGSVRPVETS